VRAPGREVICARCNYDSKSKDRTDGRCPSCHGKFAFKQGCSDPISDKTFSNAIAAVSANGELRWGIEHLHYEITRRLAPGRARIGQWFGGCVFVFFVWKLFDHTKIAPLLAAASIFCLLMACYAFYSRRYGNHPPNPRFDDLWKRWVETHSMPHGAIQRRSAPDAVAPADKEPDLELYSFDRAVICDRARTVDLLLANNFHFENNCAVISLDGYPRGAFDAVRSMLKRNPRLQIFALHDCTPAGCMLAHRLANEPEWFRGKTVVDVGLRPVHLRLFRNLLPARAVPSSRAITPAERAWLTRHHAELAALRPEQVLKRLFKAMSRRAEPERETELDSEDETWSSSSSREARERRNRADDDAPGTVITDTESFAVDADADSGGADAFG
jgi:hypothetical protein